jgi:hypothetical protein
MKNLSETELKGIFGGIGDLGGCTRLPVGNIPQIEYVDGVLVIKY